MNNPPTPAEQADAAEKARKEGTVESPIKNPEPSSQPPKPTVPPPMAGSPTKLQP